VATVYLHRLGQIDVTDFFWPPSPLIMLTQMRASLLPRTIPSPPPLAAFRNHQAIASISIFAREMVSMFLAQNQ